MAHSGRIIWLTSAAPDGRLPRVSTPEGRHQPRVAPNSAINVSQIIRPFTTPGHHAQPAGITESVTEPDKWHTLVELFGRSGRIVWPPRRAARGAISHRRSSQAMSVDPATHRCRPVIRLNIEQRLAE